MDTKTRQDSVLSQGNVIIDSDEARVGDTAVRAPVRPMTTKVTANGGPPLPGGPYATYQPLQPGSYAPAAPILPGRARREGPRATSPALWVGLSLLVGVAIVLSVAVLAAARIFGDPGTAQLGPQLNESRSVPLGTTKAVDLELTMRAGDLTVTGGGTDLLNADFSYNVAAWKPEIGSSIAGESSVLLVKQPEQGGFTGGKMVNNWNLHLNNNVPLNLKANLGAGNTEFRLAGLNVTKAEIIVGAGNTTVDMSGLAGQNANIRVINSLGKTTVVLPTDMGVKVTLERGMGKISTGTLKGGGNTYTNEAYGNSPRTINLYVEVAVGNVVFQSR